MENEPQIEDFVYEPIDHEGLRLLKVQIDGKVTQSALKFEFSEYPRAKAPTYVALSYTWGVEEASEIIYLNGRKFWVRPNLKACLDVLVTYRAEWEYIWIDAICINQNDTPERNVQVRQMAETYRNAATVVAWLGDDNDADVGFSAASRRWKEGWRSADDDGNTRNGFSDIVNRWKAAKPWSLSGVSPQVMEKLLNRSYWSRTWIIQELRLAQNVEFLWGPSRFDWIDFVPLVQMYSLLHPKWKRLQSRVFVRFGDTLSPMARPSVVPLGELLRRHYESCCFDPRDRVFGLLGLLSDEARATLGSVLPDYDLSFKGVMLITIAWLKQDFSPISSSVRSFYPAHVLGLSETQWKEWVSEVGKYETTESQTAFAKTWNEYKLKKLESLSEKGPISGKQMNELHKRKTEHESWLKARVDVLQAIAHDFHVRQ